MLNYNFDRVFKARGIEKRFTFLKNAGFGDHLASKIKNNKVVQLRLKETEKLCLLLRCTPNDLYEWEPDDQGRVDDQHPLNVIRKREKIADIFKTLNAVPLEKVEEIDRLVNEYIAAKKPDIE